MKYIKRVILENFQSHKYSIIDFDNQLNVIVGHSDSGKTAILRGIKWALYNEPSGDYFIREGSNECSVTVVFSDGVKIKRYRSKSKNSYFLYDSDESEMKFEGFGTSVPQEILDAAGIKKILLDGELSNAINISDQLEGAFLLSEKTSTRANSIGRIVGVNIIDDALRESLKDNRNLSNERKSIIENINNLETELREYDYLDELAVRLNEIEDIKNKIQEDKEKLDLYLKLLQNLSNIQGEKEEVVIYNQKLKDVNIVSDLYLKIYSYINKYNLYSKQASSIKKIEKDKIETNSIITLLNDIDKVEINTNIIMNYNIKLKELTKLYESYTVLKREVSNIEKINISLKDIQIIDKNLSIISEKKLKYIKLLDARKKTENLKKSLGIGRAYINKLQNIDSIYPLYLELEIKIKKLKKIESIGLNIGSLLEEIKMTIELLKNIEDEINILKLKFRDNFAKLEICPLCFSTIDNEKLENIIKHYD